MTEQIRNKIVSAIENWIADNGSMPLRILKNVLREANIPEEEFEKVQPKSWILRQFPEFMINGTNGFERIVTCDPIIQILENATANEGKILLSAVSPLLSAEGIEWKEYANGKKLYEWLHDSYGFSVSEDKLWLYVDNSAQNDTISDPLVMPDQITRNYVYQFCFFPANSTMLKQVRELTEDTTISPAKWASLRTISLSQCLLGLNGGILDDSQGEIPRLAFNTCLKTPHEQELYGILTQNLNEGAIQHWVLTSIAFPGQESEEGHWLCSAFGLSSQASYGNDRYKTVEVVKAALATVQESQDALISDWANVQQIVEDGRALPEEFAKAINSYICGWTDLEKALALSGTELEENTYSIRSVQEILNEWNHKNDLHEELNQKFEQLAQDSWLFMKDNMLCRENLSSEDISAWSTLLQQEFNAETMNQLHKQLEPFQALMVLRSFDPATDGVLGVAQYEAMDVVNEHFDSNLTPSNLRHSICNKSIDMTFLNLLPEISALLKQIEYKSTNPEQSDSSFDDENLLDAAINGNIWAVTRNAFKEPNALEKAAMLGDFKSIQSLIEDTKTMDDLGYDRDFQKTIIENAKNLQLTSAVTPVHAALRLEDLFGPSCESIDHCLLLGVMQHESDAIESLIHRYINTNRCQLACKLFQALSELLPTESRKQVLLELVASNSISLDTAIQTDILTLLSDDGISIALNGDFDKTVLARLESLYEQIKPTLIHHIVFLSPELQSYVLRPENIDELSKYPIDLSENGVAVILRQNSYARGNTPLQVAMRINSFIGNWNDLAKQFALLAANTPERQEFLYNLFYSQNDDVSMLKLLQDNPELAQQHFSYYVDLLFKNEQYDELCKVANDNSKLSVLGLMQKVISEIRTGIWNGDIPDFDTAQAVENADVLLQLGDEIAAVDRNKHIELLLKVFSAALIMFQESELKSLVTATGQLNKDEIYEIAKLAAEKCPALTVYCCKLIDTDDFQTIREAYLQELYNGLNTVPDDEQYNLARELRILNPEKYSIMIEELLVVQFKEIMSQNETPAVKAKSICDLLSSTTISDDLFGKLIDLISGQDIITYAPLYRQLAALAQNDDNRVRYIRLLHQYREKGDDEFITFLCEQYIDLDKQGCLPEDILLECEPVLLSKLNIWPDKSAHQCVYNIEKIKNRLPYVSFAQYMIEHVSEQIDSDKKIYKNDNASVELTLLCDVLEDDFDIEDYLTFCAAFVDPAQGVTSQDSENEFIDAEQYLHVLYHNPKDAKAWCNCEKLFPQERPKAHASALFFYASYQSKSRIDDPWEVENSISKANAAWEKCVLFCVAENQDNLFFNAIHIWLSDINNYYVGEMPWYSTKDYMQTLQKILESSDPIIPPEKSQRIDFPSCSKETSTGLIKDLIKVFKRIEQDKSNSFSGDDNHNTLRVIVELGILLECEDILIEQLIEEFTGPYVNLGLAMICRLLLSGKIDTAMPFLSHFAYSSTREYNYNSLVKLLASMNDAKLTEWLQDEGNRATLRFILPNGNVPDVFRLQTLVMSGCSGNENDRNVCISVIENLLDCYPRDVMCYTSLYILCKEDYSSNLYRILRALVGIFKFYPSKGREQFTRDKDTILNLITILRQTMEAMRYSVPSEIESNTDLVRSYYNVSDINIINDRVSKQNQLASELKNIFVGVSSDSESFNLLTSFLLGTVTGNWKAFVMLAFQNKTSNWVNAYSIDKYKTWGLLRSILRVWRELPSEEERDEFSDWIMEKSDLEDKSNVFKHVKKDYNNITKRINSDNINWSILRLPWEEHFVCIGNLKDNARPEKNSCYKIMMTERPKGQSARDCFVLTIRLAQDKFKAQLLFGNAKDWFRKGDYALAGAAYEALAISKIMPEQTTKETYQSKVNYYSEIYETWMRISYTLAGTEKNIKNCSAHSCMNMMTALLNAGYAKYFDRLRPCFSGNNLNLFWAVRKIISATVNEDEMIDMISDFCNEQSAYIAFLHFLLSKNKNDEYLFLTDQNQISSLSNKLASLEEKQVEYKKNKHWIALLKLPDESLFPPIEEELATDESAESEIYPVVDLNTKGFVPKFILEANEFIKDDDGEKSVQEMLDEFDELNAYSDSDYSKRLELSAKIYFALLNEDKQLDIEHAVVRFGVNYYYFYRNRISKSDRPEHEINTIHRTMLDLAIYGLNNPSVSAEVINFLPNSFQYSIREFSSIDSLLEDYALNKNGYVAVARLLSDTEYSNASNVILEILNSLMASINRLGTKVADMRSYQTAQYRLSEITSSKDWHYAREWNEMMSALSEMLRQAINKLDQRPSLKITIFNQHSGLQNDGIYGEIENTGRESASKIELQVTFPENERQPVSALYHLSVLKPNEKAAFSVRYKTSNDMTELNYILNVSYNYHETQINMEPMQGVLSLSPNIEPPMDIPQFDIRLAAEFTVNEQGEIVSQNFKGRKSEIHSLTSLLSGDDFSKYKSAIVQGIKRSGKTSLLNYLRTFIRATKGDNTIHLYFDCQSITIPYVYKAFFRVVLDELPLEYPPVLSHPDWPEFVSRWKLNEGESDREPEDLSLFYRQLHRMLDGKGLYLIIDEFDVLLARLNEAKGFDRLLQSLRSLQMNPDCFGAIHLVLCGSNQLLVYNQTGSAFNQMFQSYDVIPVGQMLTNDIQDMILDMLERYPVIQFAESEDNGISPSIQWIEHFTGGLVWHTRVLVNYAIKEVLSDNRNCVYPSDICSAFEKICDYNYCRQLTDGCDEKDLLVLDAMQFLSDSYECYVSFDRLMQLLESEMSAEQLKKSLAILTDSVELLEQKAPNVRSYRFRIELYRRYFRTRESKFFGSPKSGDGAKSDLFIIADADTSVETVDSDSEFDIDTVLTDEPIG